MEIRNLKVIRLRLFDITAKFAHIPFAQLSAIVGVEEIDQFLLSEFPAGEAVSKDPELDGYFCVQLESELSLMYPDTRGYFDLLSLYSYYHSADWITSDQRLIGVMLQILLQNTPTSLFEIFFAVYVLEVLFSEEGPTKSLSSQNKLRVQKLIEKYLEDSAKIETARTSRRKFLSLPDLLSSPLLDESSILSEIKGKRDEKGKREGGEKEEKRHEEMVTVPTAIFDDGGLQLKLMSIQKRLKELLAVLGKEAHEKVTA